MVVRVAALLALLLCAPALAAEPPTGPWERTGAPAGVKWLARTDAAWLAATEKAVLRSTDDGRTWQVVQVEVRTVEGLERLADLPLKPTALAGYGGTAVLATHDHGVFASTDGGASWRRILAMPFVEHADVSAKGIAVAGLFAAWLSTDAGETWTAHCVGVEDGIEGVAVVPDGVLVSAGKGLRLSRRAPGGHRRCEALPGPEVDRLAGTGTAVFRSDGCRVERSADGLVWQLVRDRCAEQGYLGDMGLAGEGSAVLVTDDNGTLLRATGPAGADERLSASPEWRLPGGAWLVAVRGTTVVAGNGEGLFRRSFAPAPAPEPRALPALEAACAKGDAGACREALLVHRAELDPARRLAASLRACEKGEGPDCAPLAEEREALASKKTGAAVVKVLTAACSKGSGAACQALAAAHREGRGVPKAAVAANTFARKACEAKVPDVAGCLAFAPGPKDAKVAGALRVRACELGDYEACAFFAGGVHGMEALTLGVVALMMPEQIWAMGCSGGSDSACLERARVLVGDDLEKNLRVVVDVGPEEPELMMPLAFTEKGPLGRSGWTLRACALGAEKACDFAAASWTFDKDGPADKVRGSRAFEHGKQLGCRRGKAPACKALAEAMKATPARRAEARPFYARACKLGDEGSCATLRALQDVLQVAPLQVSLEMPAGEAWQAEPAEPLCQRLSRLDPAPATVRFCRLPRGRCEEHLRTSTFDRPGWVGGYWWSKAAERRQADGQIVELCVDHEEGYVTAEVELGAGAPDPSVQSVVSAVSLKLGPPPVATRPFKVRQISRTIALPLSAQWTTRPDEMGDEKVDRMLQQDGPLDVLWAPMGREECVDEVRSIGSDRWPPGFGGAFVNWGVTAQATVTFKGLHRWVVCARAGGAEYVVFITSDESDFGGRVAAEKLKVLLDAMAAAR